MEELVIKYNSQLLKLRSNISDLNRIGFKLTDKQKILEIGNKKTMI